MALETARCEELAKKLDVKHALRTTSIHEQPPKHEGQKGSREISKDPIKTRPAKGRETQQAVQRTKTPVHILIPLTPLPSSSITSARLTPSAGTCRCPPTGDPHSGHRACSMGIPHSPTVKG